MKLDDFIRSNKKVLSILLVVGLAAFGLQVTVLSNINLGFEGAKCHFYGIHLGSAWDGWLGSDQFHAYHDHEDPIATASASALWGFTNVEAKLYWGNIGTPNQAGLGLGAVGNVGFTGVVVEYPELEIQVESNVQLEAINKQGDPDPLGWNDDDPLEGRRIEYWSKKAEKVTETEDKIIYEYELTKESFLIVPSEFWTGFYLVPSQNNAGTGSGWREGEWQDITAWFRLDFHTWDNAYYDEWLEDPDAEVYTTEYDGTVTSEEKLVDPTAYRGGFPITGWIQGWEKADMTSDPLAGEQQSSIWYNLRSQDTGSYTDHQLYELREILMSKVEFSPGMVGSFISLYDEPGVSFSYEPSNTNFETGSLTDSIKAPDSSMKKVMYFPINIENFGTYAEAHTWGLTGYTIYYPNAYFRIRMIYGVYGTFKYLWTEEVTKPFINETTGEYEGGLDYPGEFERHGTTVIKTRGALSPFADIVGGMEDFFSNPLGQLWTFFIIMVIVIIVVTVLNPGIWSSLAVAYKSSPRKKRI